MPGSFRERVKITSLLSQGIQNWNPLEREEDVLTLVRSPRLESSRKRGNIRHKIKQVNYEAF